MQTQNHGTEKKRDKKKYDRNMEVKIKSWEG